MPAALKRPATCALLICAAALALVASATAAHLAGARPAAHRRAAPTRTRPARHRRHRAKPRKRAAHRAPSRRPAPPPSHPAPPPSHPAPPPSHPAPPPGHPAPPPSHPAPPPSGPTPTTPPPTTSPPPNTPAPPALGPNDVATPVPASTRFFSATSVWNAPLAADAQLDPSSASLVAALNGELQKEVAGIYGPWINTTQYSIPVYTVGSNVPLAHVTLDTTAPQLQSDFNAVPIPAGARAAGGSDQSLAIYQPATDSMWEFWLAHQAADGWHARWGGKMTHVSSNPGYLPNPYGGTASSLPLAGGLITINELKSGQIDHALSIALPNTAAGRFTWPAQRTDGRDTGTDAIPEGTHFRIDPKLDLSTLHLTPGGLAIARAAQRYGIIVRDTSSCIVFYAEDPGPLSSNPYPSLFGGLYPSQVLNGFPWQSLQVVEPQPTG